MSFKKKNIAILGSTGSIGISTIEIIKKKKNLFNIIILACNKNLFELSKQIKVFKPKIIIISNYNTYLKAKKKFNKSRIKIFNNFQEVNLNQKIDITVCGISGMSGIWSTFLFLKFSKKLLIANKESIVCGGSLLLKEAKKNHCKLISVDSELYSLNILLKNYNLKNVKNFFITSSGGPFFLKKKLKNISIKEALNHPTWKMGPKISVDSATLVNKIFEMIQISILYSIPPVKIKIKIHPQSKIHAFCISNNGIVDFIGHNTDMKIPIENSILGNFDNHYNKKIFIESHSAVNLTFFDINFNKYPLIKLGYDILNLGETAFVIFNVINDFFVDKFLKREISFLAISKNLINFFNNKALISYCRLKKINNISDINTIIRYSLNICLNSKFIK